MTSPTRKPGVRGSARLHPLSEGRDDTPRFASPGALLRWLFAQRRGKAQGYDQSGSRSDARSIGDRGLRLAYAALCWEAVTDERQRLVLWLRHGQRYSEAQIADRLDMSARTLGRLVSRGERAVRARALELAVMEEL